MGRVGDVGWLYIAFCGDGGVGASGGQCGLGRGRISCSNGILNKLFL